MADQEETFAQQNSPGGSDSRELQSDNKSEKQNGTSSKSPSSQTTYIQQVSSISQSVCLQASLSLLQAASNHFWVTFTVKKIIIINVFTYSSKQVLYCRFMVLKYTRNIKEKYLQMGWSNYTNFTYSKVFLYIKTFFGSDI